MTRRVAIALTRKSMLFWRSQHDSQETRHADGYAHLTDCEAINPKPNHDPPPSSTSLGRVAEGGDWYSEGACG
ncbi:MAG: hypothetical protein KTR29_07585 [Rhodothermaceae bacterium]|nr:hypothetical protein [Rhodothermaceae bacterium]